MEVAQKWFLFLGSTVLSLIPNWNFLSLYAALLTVKHTHIYSVRVLSCRELRANVKYSDSKHYKLQNQHAIAHWQKFHWVIFHARKCQSELTAQIRSEKHNEMIYSKFSEFLLFKRTKQTWRQFDGVQISGDWKIESHKQLVKKKKKLCLWS